MKISKKTLLIVFAFISIYAIWGSTYLLNKIIVTELDPLYIGAIRFFTSGVLIFIIALVLKMPLKISKTQFKNSAIAGFLFLVYGNGGFVWGLKFVDSGFAALIAATQPLFVIILMRLLYKSEIKPQSIIGVALGIIGMYLLINQKALVLNEKSIFGIVLMISCILSWSYGSIFVSKFDLPKNFFIATGYQMLTASSFLFFLSYSLNETWVPPLDWSSKVQCTMLLLIVFGSIVAFTAFNYLLKVVSTEKVATSAYVNPVIALFLGWYVLDEYVSSQSIIATFVLLTGVYFINSKKKSVVFSRFRKK